MKKGQASLTGFIVTIVLIIAIVSLFYSQFSSLFLKESAYVGVSGDSEQVARILTSEGFPVNWDHENVRKIGLLDGDKVSLTKLGEFALIDYSTTKKLLGIRYDYMMFIEKDGEKVLIPNLNRDFLGWNGYITDYEGNGGYPFESFFKVINEHARNIARSEQFVYLEDQIASKSYAKLVVYTWDPVDFEKIGFECNDSIDNEPDGFIDYPVDLGCVSQFDDDEENPPYSLSCSYVENGLCINSDVEIIEISKKFAGLFPRHAAVNGSGYPGRICCNYGRYISVNYSSECSSVPAHVWFRMDKIKNAHIQRADMAFPGATYSEDVCITGIAPEGDKDQSQDISCQWENAACSAGWTCVFSIAGDTNAHVRGCDAADTYDLKLCCKFVDWP